MEHHITEIDPNAVSAELLEADVILDEACNPRGTTFGGHDPPAVLSFNHTS